MEIYQSDWENLPYWPNPNCSLCKGAGFVHPVGDGGKADWARTFPCKNHGCLADSLMAYRTGKPFLRQHGVVDKEEQTFGNFLPIEGTQKSLEYAKQLAYGKSSFIWLLICGGTGSGKSHLCNAIAKEVLKRGIDAQLILSAELFSSLRLGMSDHTTEQRIKAFKDIFFLIIDECGLEYGSNWEEEKFDELMSFRWMIGSPTVVTSNKDIAALPARVKSRFEDGRLSRIVLNRAPDYRKGRK